MNKKIEVEYCGSWGFRGPASRLKNILQQAFPGSNVGLIEAASSTSRIDVKVVDGDKQSIVWSGNRAEATKSDEEIKQKIKNTMWFVLEIETRETHWIPWSVSSKILKE